MEYVRSKILKLNFAMNNTATAVVYMYEGFRVIFTTGFLRSSHPTYLPGVINFSVVSIRRVPASTSYTTETGHYATLSVFELKPFLA